MNILYSSTADLSKPCAQRTHVSEIVNNLAKLGHKVYLIVLRKGDLKLHSNVTFYKLFPFINKRLLSLATLYAQKTHVKSLIRNIIKKEEIDVIYERHNDYDYGIKIGKGLGIKTVLELNGVIPQEAKLQGVSEEQVKIIDNKELEKIKYADKIVAVSKGIKEYYSSLGIEKNKFAVIPNGVNIDLFKPMDKKESRKKLGFGNYPIIGFVGSFRPYQELNYAIRMMPYVLKEMPQARLVLVGDAGTHYNFQFHPTVDELKELAKRLNIEKNVLFTGRVEHNKVNIYINSFDVCLNLHAGLSFNEYFLGSSVKLFEYLACNKPVFVSNYKNTRFVKEVGLGKLINHRDLKSDAKKIVNLMHNPKLTQLKKGRELIKNEYTWKTISGKIINELI